MIVDITKVRRRDRSLAGLAGLGTLYDTSPVNPTTMWTPTTGFLSKPGDITTGQINKPQVTSVYDVPGLLLPYQSCLDAMGGSAGSADCVNQNLATEAENFKRTAAYNTGTLQIPTTPIIPPIIVASALPSTATPTNITNQVNNQTPTTQQNQMLSSTGGIVNTLTSDLGGNVSIMGYSIPIWAVALVVGGGLFMVAGKH